MKRRNALEVLLGWCMAKTGRSISIQSQTDPAGGKSPVWHVAALDIPVSPTPLATSSNILLRMAAAQVLAKLGGEP